MTYPKIVSRMSSVSGIKSVTKGITFIFFVKLCHAYQVGLKNGYVCPIDRKRVLDNEERSAVATILLTKVEVQNQSYA